MWLRPKTPRIYFFTGGAHGPGSLTLKRTNTQNIPNPLDFRWGMRGLLIAFHDWLKAGVEPPASAFPSLAKQQIAPAAELKYPTGIHPPQWPRVPQILDFGADFLTTGIVTAEPPKPGAAYRILVPKVDRAGIEMGGVRMPEIDVPLGAYAGWNLRAASIGNPDRMIAFIGSYFPFDSAEVKKRYSDKQTYLASIRRASESLVSQRYALRADVDKMVERAGQLWDAQLGIK